MLVPIKSSGGKPPLFFVHGYHGILFSLGADFARELGSDQPFYGFHANGMDGRQPVINNVREMVPAYFDELQRAWPEGPLRIGGQCQGCYVAVEIARMLRETGRQTGPVILADPSPVPGQDRRRRTIDPSDPRIARRLYEEARHALMDNASRSHNNLPFDPTDPKQLHAATLAVMGAVVAFAGYVPSPYPGPVEMIISMRRARSFFHPLMPYQKLFPDQRIVHVLPYNHHEIFKAGQKTLARLIRSMLEEKPASEDDIDVDDRALSSQP
jgi:thioesterase domain-containing protein